jgi:predicted exporter
MRSLALGVGRGAGGAMTPSQLACGLAVLAVACVLAVFFFPAMQGPYSVVHGPVTVRQAARAAAGLRMAVNRAGLNSVRRRVCAALVLLPGAAGRGAEFRTLSFFL